MLVLQQKGFAPIIFLLISSIVISFAVIWYQLPGLKPISTPTNLSTTYRVASPSAALATPSPSPTPSPTPAPTAIPAPTPRPLSQTAPDNGYARINAITSRGSFTASVLVMNNPTMITDTASDGDCSDNCPVLPLATYVSRNGAFAGVNGSYFCPDTYPDCQSKKNTFDFPVYQSRLHHWINGDKLSWNYRAMIYQDGGGYHFVKNANTYGGNPNAGITNYPALLDNGNVVVGDYTLSDKQNAKGIKVGLGLNGNKVYVIVAQNVDMYDFAEVFKSIGVKSALNLDTGGSTAFWYGGYIYGPGRNLPNAVVFK